jgi:hypothetical protein
VHREDGWRVAKYEIKYPDKLWPDPDPDLLLGESGKFMKSLQEGDLAAMYGRFYPDVWSRWKPSAFEADIGRLRGACQNLSLDPPTIVGTNDEGHTLVEGRMHCADGALISTRLRWMWQHGKWRLLKVSWAIPGQ